MPDLITNETFNKNNDLYIPLAAKQPSVVAAAANPNNRQALDLLILKTEEEILLNALGLEEYNKFLDGDSKWFDLALGVEYNGKRWEGLRQDYSLLAYITKFLFLNANSQFYTSVGVAQVNAENATTVSPNYVLVNCWSKFITKYQGDENCVVRVNGSFIDYHANNTNTSVSMYEYLTDNADALGWDSDNFMFYQSKNTFDL